MKANRVGTTERKTVKLIRAEMGSFRSYQEVAIDFSQRGLTRIRGRNGVGKSAIVESLAWTIFGRLPGGNNIRDAKPRISERDERGRPQQPNDPWVRWTVEIDGKTRHITRGKGHARIEDDSGVLTGSRIVSTFLAKQLGIKYDDLRATAWCLQGEVKRPVTMAKQDRRWLIRRLLLEDRESRTTSGDQDANHADIVREARKEVEGARRQLDQVVENLKEANENRVSHSPAIGQLEGEVEGHLGEAFSTRGACCEDRRSGTGGSEAPPPLGGLHGKSPGDSGD